jgi:hypothetical protein
LPALVLTVCLVGFVRADGEYLLLVKNLAVFNSQFTAPPGTSNL